MSDNQNDIPTPRTDAEYKRRVQLYPQSVTTHEVVNISFARTLERENVKLKESFNQSQEARQKWIAEFDSLKSQLAAAREEVARLEGLNEPYGNLKEQLKI